MNRSTWRKLILATAMAVLGAWLVIPQVLRRAGPAPALAATADEAAAGDDDAILAALGAVAALPGPDTPVSPGWPADPFTPRGPGPGSRAPTPAPQAPSPGLSLDGIISGTAPRALIQGQIVGIGDQLASGYTVTAIDTNSVTLAGPQGPWTLTLPR
jgi:hypothetical protein